MNTLTTALLLAATGTNFLASAHPHLHQRAAALTETAYPFQAPGASDSRSPCPGLNALANHGILPRDGKSIDLETLVAAAATGFNLGRDATLLVGGVGLKASTTGNASTFHLADLDVHSPQVIEHDGSMSRGDKHFGDNHSFNQTAWDRTLKNWGDNELLTFEIAGAERTARFAYGMSINPEFNATFANQGSLLEYSLLLSAFGDPIQGNANKTLVKYMFENERLPLSLGWVPPTTQITVATATTMAARIAAHL